MLARRVWTSVRLAVVASLLNLSAVVSARGDDPPDKKDDAPAPARWTVLFRADDPAAWDSNAKGEKGGRLAIPLKFAPTKFRYLRLRRMDTEEALILPLTPDQLQNGKVPKPEEGFWWNGTSLNDFGGRKLGIVQSGRNKFPGTRGQITVMYEGWDGFTGSGFGHRYGVNDVQGYCWRGKEIKKTVFEIAVTDDPLSPKEKRSLVTAVALARDEDPADKKPARGEDPADKKDDGTTPARWSALFRSDDPSVWNTDAKGAKGEQVAVPLKFAPAKFRYLRLRRMDTGEALILPLTPDQLKNGKPPKPEEGFWWNGANKDEYKGRHLGIVEGPRRKFPEPKGLICVMHDGWDGFAGSGFGHKYGVGDAQYYSWRGKEIKQTVFEIAVTDDPLSAKEKRFLVTAP